MHRVLLVAMDLRSAVQSLASGGASLASGGASSSSSSPADVHRAAFLQSVQKRKRAPASTEEVPPGKSSFGFTFAALRQLQDTVMLCCAEDRL